MRALILLAIVVCAYADDGKYAYHGLYPGNCAADGLYYKDYTNYVMCTGGLAYPQVCSPGTKCSEEGKYTYGDYYSLGDFCNVNLLAASYKPVVNTYHAPVPSYHAPVPSYHAPLPVHAAPVVKEAKEEAEEEVKAEVGGFSRKGLYEGYGQTDGKFVFRGKYADSCKLDGLYYRDYQSYVICSNNNAYVQPCAPGTRNSVYDKYAFGGYYSYADFCDVNLTDFGYAAKRAAYGYAARKKLAYGYPGYGYGAGYGLGYGYGYPYAGYAKKH